jgi:integrase
VEGRRARPPRLRCRRAAARGRHTYCSTQLAAGVSPAAVSRYAGHASVSFTLARYVKALAGTEASDVARVEALLAAAES